VEVLAKHFRGFGDPTRLRIVRAERRGKQVFYSLADKQVSKVIDLTRGLVNGDGA